jgi:hypothetical protein
MRCMPPSLAQVKLQRTCCKAPAWRAPLPAPAASCPPVAWWLAGCLELPGIAIAPGCLLLPVPANVTRLPLPTAGLPAPPAFPPAAAICMNHGLIMNCSMPAGHVVQGTQQRSKRGHRCTQQQPSRESTMAVAVWPWHQQPALDQAWGSQPGQDSRAGSKRATNLAACSA